MLYYDEGRLMYKCGICHEPRSANGELLTINKMPELILEGEILVCSVLCRLMLPKPYFQLTSTGDHPFSTQLRMHIKPIFRGGMDRILAPPILYNVSRGYVIAIDRYSKTID